MNFETIKQWTGYSKQISRIRRLATLSILAFVLYVASHGLTSWLLYKWILATSAANFQTLAEAGLSDLVTSPEVVEHHVYWLLTVSPMLGLVVILPVFVLVLLELGKLPKDC